jgi:general secretion pathway protein D
MAFSLIHRIGKGRARLVAGLLLAGVAGWMTGMLRAQEPARPSLRDVQEQPAAGEVEAERNEVQGYRVPLEQLPQVTRELQSKYKGRAGVRIEANERIQSVIVIAPLEIQAEVAAFLTPETPEDAAPPPSKPVEQRALPPAAERVRGTHPLRNVSARDFELALARIWARRASFTTSHDRRNTYVKVPFGKEGLVALTIDHEQDLVTIDMPRAAQDSWRQVLAAIDSARRAGGTQAELVALDKAEPENIQKALRLIRSVTQPLTAGEGPKKHIGQFVSMIFQQEQPPAAQPRAAQPVEGQPAERQPGEGQPPREGQPAEGAAEEDLDGGKIGPVDIQYIEGLDIFIIRGKKRDVERVQRIIAQIEAESEKTRPEVEIYMLEHVDDQAMALLINQIYTPALGARQGTVTVVPLVKPNALLLIGRREANAAVVELIKKIDQPVAPDRMLRVFSLKYLSAIDAETKLRMFFTDRPGQAPTLRGGLGTRALIIADYRTNALIVQASPRDMEEVAQILDSLDIQTPTVKNEIRVFRLKNSMAEDLIPALQEAIYSQQLQQQIQAAGGGPGQQLQQGAQGQQGGGAGGAGTPTQSRSTPKPTGLQLQRVNENGVVELLESGILSDMRLSADPRANALIVTGPAASMELMAALIEQLDGLPAVSAQVKIFRLIDADATQMATMLQTLFGQQANQQQGVQGFQSVTGGGENTLVPLKFSVDTRTNSIIASGNAGDLAVVYRILVGLDEKDLRGRVTSVYMLKNTTAEPVATAINQYLTNRQTLNQQATNLVSPVNVWDQAIIVVPEPITNSLIVNASPRYAEEIKGIIKQLDQRKNMVAIQVLIAEVKLSDIEQFGIELGIQDSLLFDRGIGTVGFPFNQATVGNATTAASLATRNAAASQGLSNLGMGRTDATLGYGGLVLSASSDSVNVLIRALQHSNRLQVLSRPQVQTLDNQQANVQVGAEVRMISGTTITNGIAQNTVVPVDVGIILQVTPRTNADGNIIMFVDVTKSELGPESEGTAFQSAGAATGAIRIPQIKKTVASTTVNTRSGQTVILGGLITRSQNETTRRVPYLADVPVLGRLFRFDSTQVDRTELLVIMTPYIIQTDEQENWFNQRESERMSWCLADVANIHGEVPYITGNAGVNAHASPLIFPDDPNMPEEVAPPPVPGIAPPPMGPLPNVLPSTSRRNGPQLQPLTIAPLGGESARNPTRERGNVRGVQAPPGAGVIGNTASPAIPSYESLSAPEVQTATPASGNQPQTNAVQDRPRQRVGQLPPPPKLTVPEIESAGYSDASEEPGGEPVEPAIYR